MAVAVFVHTMLFIIFWLTNLLFKQSVNTFLSDATGIGGDFLKVFLYFATFVLLWSVVRLVLRKRVRKAGSGWLYNAIGGFFMVFFYGSFIVLFLKNPVQVARLGQFVQYFRIFVDAVVLCLAAWGLRVWLVKLTRRWQKTALVVVFLALWLVPVFLTPGLVYRGALPEKPVIIAHRGASLLAPENTLSSMGLAAKMGVYGLETDITVSDDGVLFLMHDSTLERTTNVTEVFPGREKDKADSFTWDELAQLDAGSWFVGRLSYSGEPIPTLAEMLQIVQAGELYWIYDLRIPADDHPYADRALALTLEEIKASGVAPRTWVLAAPEEIPVVRATLPDAILARGLNYRQPASSQELVVAGYQLVNSEYGLSNRMIHVYQNAGLWVNLWTVDEPWQYSRLWLAGADSVTTNNSDNISAPLLPLLYMRRPVMSMPYTLYLVVWGVIGIIAAGICAVRLKRAR